MTNVRRAATKLLALAIAAALSLPGAARASPPELVRPSDAWVKISAAQLRAEYDTLWAVSDVHGRLEELERLLLASRLAARAGPRLAWNDGSRRQLLVVAGDLIDGGRDSVGVALLLERLQREAAAASSRIVVLLGNHEAAFLAYPRSASPELMASAARHAAELGAPQRLTAEQLEATAFGVFLRGLPVAAFIGSWLFAHAGYVDAKDSEKGLREYFGRLEESVARRDRKAFAALLDRQSIVSYHRWWASERRLAKLKDRLTTLGLNGLVFGHDPNALGAPRTIAMNRDGWLIKLDTGLKSGRSAGMLLRCEVADVASADELAMVRGAAPTCRTVTPGGSVRALVVVR
jgi:Calcineurin-like phosphoesterase